MPPRPSLAWFSKQPLRWALPLTVVISLAGTADMIFREDVRRLYETNGDIAAIMQNAANATPASVLKWWTGVWIEPSSPYYRPLVSALIYAEYLAFGGRWRGFCLVTWLMHAGVCVVMLLLLRSLWPGSPARRVIPGLLAAGLFSIPCETTVNGPHWGNRGIARGLMPYWPAQTDVGCLLLSLACLLLVDRWLAGRRRRTLIGAGACFVGALLFKEQAVVVPLLVGVVALYRRQPLRFVSLVAGSGLAASALFLLLRRLLVPQAWGPEFKGVGPTALKLLVYLSEPSALAVANHQAWIIVSAALVTACVAVALWRPRFLVYAVLGAFVAVFLPPQLLNGNMALPTVLPQAWWLLRAALELLLLLFVWELRGDAPTLPLLAGVLIVHLPILHVIGPHYYYWPVAWWSMLDATVIVAVLARLRPTTPPADASPVACPRARTAEEVHSS